MQDADAELMKKGLEKKVAVDGVLDMSFQKLETIPSWVWRLSSLRTLLLNNNAITEVKLPKDAHVPVLERVDLSNNLIRELPQTLVELLDGATFRLLDVSNNKLEILPEQFLVLFQDKELSVHVYHHQECGAGSSLVRVASDLRWPGWRGKIPKEGIHVIRAKGNSPLHSFVLFYVFCLQGE